MRMRRKKFLEERTNSAKDKLIDVPILDLNASVDVGDDYLIDFKEIFNNNNDVVLEIGCGKGQFAINYATKYPNENMIAVEMLSNVIVKALEDSKPLSLNNLRFIVTRAEYLNRYIKEGSISKIFLNFSTPCPKKTQENRRLTYDRYLELYKKLLTKDGLIIQKTDNEDFYNYSLEQYKKFGYKVLEENTNTIDPNNIETEYESKFKKLNMPIYRIIVQK